MLGASAFVGWFWFGPGGLVRHFFWDGRVLGVAAFDGILSLVVNLVPGMERVLIGWIMAN